MLENSNYIEGTLARELDDLCKKYDKVKTDYAIIDEEFTKIKNRIKEICTAKTNETARFQINMKITSDGSMLDSKKVELEYPEVFQKCQKVKKGSRSIQEILKK